MMTLPSCEGYILRIFPKNKESRVFELRLSHLFIILQFIISSSKKAPQCGAFSFHPKVQAVESKRLASLVRKLDVRFAPIRR